MAYFAWAQDMVIDDGPIDEDHKHLVQLVNTLHDATTEGRGREVVGSILQELVRYTADHLRKEELTMEQAGFPNLARHKIGHQAFVNQLEKLQRRYQEGSIAVAAQLSTVLRDWLSIHIRRNDRELLEFMRRQPGAPNPPRH
jgi:hemerythrin-like metal-binding protein